MTHQYLALLADDLKLFDKICCQDDTVLLQNVLNAFQKRCDENDGSQSIEKRATISFSLKKEAIIFGYNLKKIKSSRVNEINDLGVIFYSKLNFKYHTNNVIKKSIS